MRAIVVHPGPEFSVSDVHDGWVRGLRQVGVQVGVVNLHDRLSFFHNACLPLEGGGWRKAMSDEEAVGTAAEGIAAAAFMARPDFALVISGFFVPERTFDMLRRGGVPVVLVHTESPYEDDAQLQRAPWASLNLLNDPTNLDRFRAVAPTEYVPHAYDPDRHHPCPASPDLKSDFAFCGTGYDRRIRFLEAAGLDGIDVALAGNWQRTRPDSPLRRWLVHDVEDCFPSDDTIDLYCSTKASANLYRDAGGWSMGPREVELAACGSFYLTEPRGENREVLGFLPTFDSPVDFADKLRWWLVHDDAREAIASRAREAIAGRTFAANAAHLLRLLDKR